MSKVVTFGEIMLRLATPNYQRFAQARSLEVSFGGGEANVAVALANFGEQVSYVTCLPPNDWGKAAAMELKKYNVNTDYIQWSGDRMGIYFLETGAVMRPSKVIYDRAGSSIAQVKPGSIPWEVIFEDADWFHWTGITPAISENAALVCKEAVEIAAKKGLTISVDLNFRKNLWKYGKKASDIMPELVKFCDIILGNEEDAEMVFGIKTEGVEINQGRIDALAYQQTAAKLMNLFPKVKKVIITLRGSVSANHNTWSGVLWNGIDFLQAPTYQITHIVDRVGGGDSFMAGLIYALRKKPGDDSYALRFAVAASALKHTIHGDFNLVTVDEVNKLMSGDASGRVMR
ncbi:MAG: sugar kinase [Bacteroidales bacterium]|nr:sugar kinase [Bacteroidales bacterium]